MDCDIEEVGLHCNGMNDAGDRVNTLQNEIMAAENDIKCLKENTDRKRLDLRLKYKRRIDQANIYYNAKNDLQEMESKVNEAKNNYRLACQGLTDYRENIFADLSTEANRKMRSLRDSVSATQDHLAEQEKKRSGQLAEVTRLHKKYKKSVELTKEYFDAKRFANDELHRLREKQKILQQELSNWREIYSDHMARLQEISDRIHLERSTAKTMADQRLLNSENDDILNGVESSIDDLDMNCDDIWVDSLPDFMSEPDDDTRSICSLTDSLNSNNNNGNLLRPHSHIDSRSCGSPARNKADRVSLRSNSPYRRSVSDHSPASSRRAVEKGCITAHETAVSWHPLG